MNIENSGDAAGNLLGKQPTDEDVQTMAKMMLSVSEESLLIVLKEYRASVLQVERECWKLIVGAAIYAYELSNAWASVSRNYDPLLMSLGLKDVVHKLYEYDDMISRTYVQRVTALSKSIGVSISQDELRGLRKALAPSLFVIKKYKRVRNIAGGHISDNVEDYIQAVSILDVKEVNAASLATHKFNANLIDFLHRMIQQKTNELIAARALKD